MRKWLKTIWKQYKKGAEANHYPFSKYGLLGERLTKEQRIIEKLKNWLGPKGIRLFRSYKYFTGKVDPVFGMNPHRRCPHPVHFREGMAIRNFLRSLPECKDWNDHDFDNNWARLVGLAISET